MLYRFLFLVVAVALCAVPVEAQVVNPNNVVANGVSYHVFAQPGDPIIEVIVLGDTPSGIYVVGESTTLTELLALAGATTSAADSPNTKVERTIRVLRDQGGARAVIYEAQADEMVRSPESHPNLVTDDVISIDVKTSQRFSLRDTLSIVSSAASVTLLILRLVDSRR